jgi:hypothetical protein
LLRVLHLHSSFSAGGKELRCARLINAFGPVVSHSIVSAQPNAFGASKAIEASALVDYPTDFPALAGRPGLRRLRELAGAMAAYDLVLSYNWGAMDGVMAHRIFAKALRLPPLVHHEDGFNQDEAQGLKPSRNWYRRLALGRASALVVPSERLEHIALHAWRQPRGRVWRIANGIATSRYAQVPRPDVLPGLTKQPGELWLGTIAGLRAVKNLPRLVRAFAKMPEPWRLVILGEGPERAAILAEAVRQGVESRVHLPGFVADPASVIGLFDLFALSSDSEQFPISVVEALAAGLAQQDVFVREVDDALREDQLKEALQRHGRIAAVALGAALLALGGFLWWREHQQAVAGEAGEKFMVALDQVEAARLGPAYGALEPLAAKGPDGARTAAKLMQAGIALEQGNRAQAAKLYAEIAAGDDVPRPYRDLALIRQTAVEFDRLSPATVVTRLKPLAAPGNPWFGSAGELVGAAYLKQGRGDLAGPLFAAIAKDADVPESLRGRARQLAGMLGVDAIVDVDRALANSPVAPAGAAAPQ